MPNPRGGTYGFVGLFPIRHEADCRVLRQTLRALDGHPQGSPLSTVAAIHMARLIILDEAFYEGTPAKMDHLANRYLLFVCNFDGADPADLAVKLAATVPLLVAEIWGGCFGCPDMHNAETRSSQLSAYFKTCQIDVNFYASLQADASVPEILRAVQLKRCFTNFVKRNQLTPPGALQAAFALFWACCHREAPPPLPGTL